MLPKPLRSGAKLHLSNRFRATLLKAVDVAFAMALVDDPTLERLRAQVTNRLGARLPLTERQTTRTARVLLEAMLITFSTHLDAKDRAEMESFLEMIEAKNAQVAKRKRRR